MSCIPIFQVLKLFQVVCFKCNSMASRCSVLVPDTANVITQSDLNEATDPWSCSSTSLVQGSWRSRGIGLTAASAPSRRSWAGSPWGCYPCLCSVVPTRSRLVSVCRRSESTNREWNYKQEECILVGCVPPACCPYLPACTARGCTWSRGVYLVQGEGGTWFWGGVPGPEGCNWSRGGVPGLAGYLPGYSPPLWTE